MPQTDLQKMLFLVCAEQDARHGKPAYEFVPYRYGCYSFQAEADKRTLTKYKLLRSTADWQLGSKRHFAHLLDTTDKTLLDDVVRKLGSLHSRKLIQYVYRHYPYYAINSELRDQVLTDQEQAMVAAARPPEATAGIYTIGYEGKTLERFLNVLLGKNIRVLCDLRRNALSMKFGFSKRQLTNAVQELGIVYVHMPELGIDSMKRRELEFDADYQALFDEYRRTTLASNSSAVEWIAELTRNYEAVAFQFLAFHKYQWVELDLISHDERRDFRPESRRPKHYDLSDLRISGPANWRNRVERPFKSRHR